MQKITTDDDKSAIGIENLSLSRGGSTLFSDLTLALAPGEKAVVKAPSGFGKSTLLRCLLGFVPVASGSVRIFGTELTPRSAWPLRCRMAYVDQEPDLGDETVEAVLKRPFSYKNNQHLRPDPERTTKLMEQLYLPKNLLGKHVSALSGGERQRITLIAALLLKREILLLDEPTSALDRDAAEAVVALLNGMPKLTVLAISHDSFLTTSFDRVIDLPEHCRRTA